MFIITYTLVYVNNLYSLCIFIITKKQINIPPKFSLLIKNKNLHTKGTFPNVCSFFYICVISTLILTLHDSPSKTSLTSSPLLNV